MELMICACMSLSGPHTKWAGVESAPGTEGKGSTGMSNFITKKNRGKEEVSG